MKIIMCVFGDSSLSIGNNYLPKKSGGKILKKCAQRATTVVNILKLSHSFTLFSFFLSLFSSLLFSSLLFSLLFKSLPFHPSSFTTQSWLSDSRCEGLPFDWMDEQFKHSLGVLREAILSQKGASEVESRWSRQDKVKALRSVTSTLVGIAAEKIGRA